MRAGTLEHTITIQEKTETSDNMGGYTVTWGALAGMANISAAIWPVKVDELVQAGQEDAVATHRIRIYYNDEATVTHDMRVSFGSRVFYIKSIVRPEESSLYLDLVVKEHVD